MLDKNKSDPSPPKLFALLMPDKDKSGPSPPTLFALLVPAEIGLPCIDASALFALILPDESDVPPPVVLIADFSSVVISPLPAAFHFRFAKPSDKNLAQISACFSRVINVDPNSSLCEFLTLGVKSVTT